jgi:hypothetical protein
MGSAANQNFISNAAFVVPTPDGVLVVDGAGLAAAGRAAAGADPPTRLTAACRCAMWS